ncbi:ATP-binding cassette, subfamily C, CydC [Halobacillus karajensis]|uniref:Heterocyst differentiation ATP-binding protein HepA n=1 Tax=Halobacillus karajensis TaxID=195088 RepID=A0A024PAA9_9BACI|nr:thiol reductant ABC exporter subunit CydC [Halobacillus karajensis]CDQ21422.1 Heterocyst differentiation ATP-binding protein HepA [Halobacillus karajensis]CDQ25357.1 Heterocyst differentiation ATP-binding protein HepA [Halobacillus karajensis]CDQ29681.1 Heterocyst differentiation ATP-binding protein HepA [Halobacillus karajensis]SEI07443.1 ATP-binding cassette, subfamily C, CydC [Halobacillus karajensis]
MKDLRDVIQLVVLEKRDIVRSILFGFLAGISAVGLFASSGYLISKAALIPPLYALTVLIAFLKLFGFARALGRYAERYYSHRATFTILSNLRLAFYKRLEPHAPRIFQKYRSGDLLSRIVGDVESLQNFFLRVYYPPVVLGIIFLATIVFTSIFSISVAVVLLLGLVITGLFIPAWYSVKQRKYAHRVREARGALSTEAAEFLYGYRDLRIYQQLAKKKEILLKTADDYLDEEERDGRQRLSNHSWNTFVTLIISWVVTGLGAFLVAEGDLNGLFLAMLVMISLTVFENAAPMAVLPSHLEDSKRASARLFSIVEKEKVDKGIWTLEDHQAPSIKMSGVYFRFPDDEREALREVTLSIPEGSKTAIVGASGSGKSTLMQLFMKFHTPSFGELSVNGVDIRKLSEESVWKNSNVVLQENHYFYGTIRQNLQLAGDILTDEEMEQALEEVGLRFDLGQKVLEKGENLSGGERQRLAIARAFLKGERLWLLDEPTSSVDALTERMIFEHLYQRAKGDTLVLISHQLNGLEKMDQIIVMEEGSVREAGTYHELIEKQGYFYEMKQIEQNIFS